MNLLQSRDAPRRWIQRLVFPTKVNGLTLSNVRLAARVGYTYLVVLCSMSPHCLCKLYQKAFPSRNVTGIINEGCRDCGGMMNVLAIAWVSAGGFLSTSSMGDFDTHTHTHTAGLRRGRGMQRVERGETARRRRRFSLRRCAVGSFHSLARYS